MENKIKKDLKYFSEIEFRQIKIAKLKQKVNFNLKICPIFL